MIDDSLPPRSRKLRDDGEHLARVDRVSRTPEVLLPVRVRVVPATALVAGVSFARMRRHGRRQSIRLEDIHLVAAIAIGALRIAITIPRPRPSASRTICFHLRQIESAILSTRESRVIDIYRELRVQEVQHYVFAVGAKEVDAWGCGLSIHVLVHGHGGLPETETPLAG